MIKGRYLTPEITSDLRKKMVFLGGPRQVGKTTFAKEIIGNHYQNPAYYNWDFREDRRNIVAAAWPPNADLLILDEIHKYKKWKNLVKGIFDKQKEKFNIIVTGSARLDIYRRGGDSLQGRYHYYRLHPFSLAEISNCTNSFTPGKDLLIPKKSAPPKILDTLLTYGGFPEPFLAKDPKILRRWHNERMERLFREDIRDMVVIRDLGSMELLSSLLPEKASCRLSLNSLREDLEVSHRAVSNWVNVLERFYYHFRIHPFVGKKIRSVKKEPKLYLWDWSEIKDEARCFENFIASHLLKFVHYLHDAEGYSANLHYLRDVDGREVDFLVTIGKEPWFAVEVKSQDTKISPNLKYFSERLKIPFLYQVVATFGIDKQINNIRLISANQFLLGLV